MVNNQTHCVIVNVIADYDYTASGNVEGRLKEKYHIQYYCKLMISYEGHLLSSQKVYIWIFSMEVGTEQIVPLFCDLLWCASVLVCFKQRIHAGTMNTVNYKLIGGL